MDNEKEIITLFVGQCGVQMGSAVFELLCVEHGLLPNGRTMEPQTDNTFKSFFQETKSGQFVPRSLFVDLEATCIEEIKTGSYRQLFHPDQLMNSHEDASNNFARGYHTVGRNLYEKSMNAIRKLVDQCNNVGAFILHGASGGGTGSGYATGLISRLHNEYSRKTKMQLTLVPSQALSSAVVEPYNSILAMQSPIEMIDMAMLFDNQALYNVCTRCLGNPHPSFGHLNKILAQVISCLTVSDRFEGPLQSQIDQLQTNLVPFPKIHFPITNYAPVTDKNRADHQSLNAVELTRQIFDPDSQLAMCNVADGKYMSIVMIYRGAVTPSDVNSAVMSVKNSKRMQFVEWCPTGFKIGINSQNVTTLPSSLLAPTSCSVSMFTNNSSINDIFCRLTRKFDLLYHKKAFVFWFVGEGMEEGELIEAREGIAQLEKEYDELSKPLSPPKLPTPPPPPSSPPLAPEPEPTIVVEDVSSVNTDHTNTKSGGLGVTVRRTSGGSRRSRRKKH